MTGVAILADDLTGAADAAGPFAAAGLSTAIPLRRSVMPAAAVISISTESRDLSPADAAAAVRDAVARIRTQHPPPELVYKKLDSALRGQPRAELVATMEALQERRAVVCPALPAEGRTTLGGRQYIKGVPLEESSFGAPGTSSDLVAIFTGDGAIPVTAIDLARLRLEPAVIANQGDGIVIVDAQSDDDLRLIAGAALVGGVRLLAGSAGLARALAVSARFDSHRPAPDWRPAQGRPILTVAGTRHEATRRQIERAARAGVSVIVPDQSCLDRPDGRLDAAADAVERELRRGRNAILTSVGMCSSPLGAGVVADRLASVVDSSGLRALLGGLVLTGGDVAAAVCRHLGADAFWLRGEVRPALPWGTLERGALPGLPVVTKAGSFGGDEALLAAAEHLARATR